MNKYLNSAKRILSKLGVLFLIFTIVNIPMTGAYFTHSATIDDNTVSTGCWAKPTTPNLIYPEDGYLAYTGSDWLTFPYMDWLDSTTQCPLSTAISYLYESYRDEALTNLAYRSGFLSLSNIPAPGTPDGNYYWRVKAFDGYNESEWSEVWLLIVDRTQTEPTPSPSPTITPTPTVAAPGDIVINEVYYDVASNKGTENKNEWIELYNNLERPVDLKNWYLKDAAGHIKNINANVDIPAKGFAVLSHDNSTWSAYWTDYAGVLSSAEVINLTGSSSWLNNDSEYLGLFNEKDVEMDAVSWGGNTQAFSPSVADVDEGHSISRKVKGVDTDTAEDWMDTYSDSDSVGPNPGTNPHPPSVEGSKNENINSTERVESDVDEDTVNPVENEKTEEETDGNIETLEDETVDAGTEQAPLEEIVEPEDEQVDSSLEDEESSPVEPQTDILPDAEDVSLPEDTVESEGEQDDSPEPLPEPQPATVETENFLQEEAPTETEV